MVSWSRMILAYSLDYISYFNVLDLLDAIFSWFGRISIMLIWQKHGSEFNADLNDHRLMQIYLLQQTWKLLMNHFRPKYSGWIWLCRIYRISILLSLVFKKILFFFKLVVKSVSSHNQALVSAIYRLIVPVLTFFFLLVKNWKAKKANCK